MLFVAAFWRLDPFTAEIVHDYGFQNFELLWKSDVYRAITQRTVLIAAAVTITDALLAFPIAFYMAKVASPRTRNLLVVAVLLPLWASYLVKVYAWRIILQEQGVLNWVLEPFGLSGPGLRERRHVARLLLPLAAVHDPAGLRGSRADPELAPRCVGRPRGEGPADALARRAPARSAGVRGGLDLHVLAHARRLHHAAARLEHAVHRERRLHQRRRREQPPVRCRLRDCAGRRDGDLPAARAAGWGVRQPMTSRTGTWLLRGATGLTLAFIYLPLLVIVLYAFNPRRTLVWPIPGLTTKWFGKAIDNPGVRDALLVSLKAALGATAIALLLGTLRRVRGRRATVSSAATASLSSSSSRWRCPGIVTGMALNATFRNLPEPFGVELGLFTIMVGHATFCIVVVYNNVVARLRRTADLARGGLF